MLMLECYLILGSDKAKESEVEEVARGRKSGRFRELGIGECKLFYEMINALWFLYDFYAFMKDLNVLIFKWIYMNDIRFTGMLYASNCLYLYLK